MKRFFILTIVLFAGIAGLRAQQLVFDENAEIRQVPAFSGIEISGAVSVYLAQGAENALAVSAGEARFNNKIKTEVHNGILKISVDGGVWNGMGWTNKKLKAYVTAAHLNSIEVSGASVVSIVETFKTDALSVEVSGASEVKGKIDVEKLKMEMSGASVARFTGQAANLQLEASGASKVDSYNLVADDCKINASGASTVRIGAKTNFNTTASGGANVYYRGEPGMVNINSSGGATVRKRVGDGN